MVIGAKYHAPEAGAASRESCSAGIIFGPNTMVWRKTGPRKQVRRHPGEQIRKEMFQAAGVLILKEADAFQRPDARQSVEGEVVGRVKPSTRPARRSWRASTSPSSVFSACSPMPDTACGSSAAKPAAQVQKSACTIFACGSPERCSGGLRRSDNRLGRTQIHVANRDHAAQNSVSTPNVGTIEWEPSRRGIIRQSFFCRQRSTYQQQQGGESCRTTSTQQFSNGALTSSCAPLHPSSQTTRAPGGRYPATDSPAPPPDPPPCRRSRCQNPARLQAASRRSSYQS